MTMDRYEEALKRAKEFVGKEECINLEYIFPELKGGEDERIRGAIIDHLKDNNLTEWAAWLEKQGESFDYEKANIQQKDFAPKVEPKFKVGDWVVDNCDNIWQVVEVSNTSYRLTDINESESLPKIKWADETFHLWTIEDAKDGDVLFEDKISSFPSPFIVIFKKKDPDNTFSSHCFIGFDGKFYEGVEEHYSENLHPATKEQWNTLEKAMADAGYAFDFEKKELKEIPTALLHDLEYDGENFGIDSLWLAKNILEKTLGEVDGYQTDDGILEHKCAIAAVNKIYKKNPAEWGEEDEDIINKILCICNDFKRSFEISPASTKVVQKDIDKIDSWLKSLKDRVQLQNTWKPSDEQMASITCAVRKMKESACYDSELVSLYQDLKKLKGE